MKKAAFRSLRITPDEFWNLTLDELLTMLEAVHEKERELQEAEYNRTAWLAANLMNASGNLKRPVTPDLLLGKQTEYKRIDREEQLQTLEKLQKQFNKDRN
ncbi:phage tail assembly chaperone [Heliophilum fasciatum]|uniref:phage tail assembly chaperone n=1 Tax=Heliophilum fasciatum TaxID=35700 RepID=UPI002226C5D5|nr:phage tail assembly chaperone [Heliophilum fasciatum]